MMRRDLQARLEPDQVREWIAATEAQLAELDAEGDRIQSRLAEARKRLMNFHELLAAITKAPVKVSDQELRIGRSVRERTIVAAVDILHQYNRPLSIQELHAAFIRLGKPLPGRGTPTNIVAHLGTSSLFVRRGRGVYALAEWEPEKDPVNAAVLRSGDHLGEPQQVAAK
jgi:hypothetical protein